MVQTRGRRLTFVGPHSTLTDCVTEWAGLSLSWRHVSPSPPPHTHTHSHVCDHVTLLFVVVVAAAAAVMLVVRTFRAEGPLASPVTAVLFSRTWVPPVTASTTANVGSDTVTPVTVSTTRLILAVIL